MKKRIIWKMLLLEVVTLGIYRIYFFIKTRNEMLKLNPSLKIKSTAFLLAPIIIVVVAFIALVVSMIASAGGRYTSSTPPVAVIAVYPLFILASILFIVWEWSYSQAVEVITGEKLSFALALVILVLVPDGIDILIIQDYFNKVDVASAHLAHAPSPPPIQ